MIEVLKTDRLPEMRRPEWLKGSLLERTLPAVDLLYESVYYPASGLDGDPMMHLGHHFWSYIYADYGYEHKAVIDSLSSGSFAGYRVLGRRTVGESELPLQRWNSATQGFLAGGNNRDARQRAQLPFAEWALLERNHGPDKPQELMSFLFFGADGVTLFKMLYVENKITPACIAIIQSSDEMGSNWTNFRDPDAYLAEAVMTNSGGSPRFLLYGGNGNPEWYRRSCWPAYSDCIAWPLRRTNGGPMDLSWNQREDALSLFERAF